MNKYHDIIERARFTNAGRECKIFCNKNFELNSQILYYDERADNYEVLKVSGVYELRMRKVKITVRRGFIERIEFPRRKEKSEDIQKQRVEQFSKYKNRDRLKNILKLLK